MRERDSISIKRTFFGYTTTIILSLIILFWIMRLWQADLTVPFAYGGDALHNCAVIKGIIDNGGYLYNPFLGMPEGSYLHDFLNPYSFYFLMIKGVSLFSENYAVALNLMFLLSFPLVAISSLYVFRQFGISYPVSVAGGLLFTFLPYHFLRGEAHLFLASYYTVPLMVMIIIWVFNGEDMLISPDEKTGRLRPDMSFKSVMSVLILLIISSAGIYYAFFGSFFLLIAGISAKFRTKNLRPFVISLVLTAVILIGTLVNMSPALLYKYMHGKNPVVVRRSHVEAEVYGLRISQLLLPVRAHRIPFLKELKEKYYQNKPTESDSSSLGIIGSCGFVFLMGRLFYRVIASEKAGHAESGVLDFLSILTLSGILFGTIGGFSSLFALLISPNIRAYNRISIYLAFFSIFAVVIMVERFRLRYIKSEFSRRFFYTGLLAIFSVGIIDQTNKTFMPKYDSIRDKIAGQSAFVSLIESKLPENSMIFQLPYTPFPEGGTINSMTDYEHLASGYLHSKKLRWSYGAMKGRDGDLWQKMVSKKPIKEFVDALSLFGFSGIHIDRFGYADRAEDVESKLTSLLKMKPEVSKDNRYSFFDLRAYVEKLKGTYTNEEWAAEREAVMHPLHLVWEEGFSILESSGEYRWRWCSKSGEMYIINTSNKYKRITMEMSFATGYNKLSNLRIKSALFSENLRINDKGIFYAKTIDVPPGRHIIKFESDAERVHAPNDNRYLVFKVSDFVLKDG